MKSLQDITQYQVPIIIGDGDCVGSEEFGTFNYVPYLPFELSEEKTAILLKMDQAMEDMHALEYVDWCGIYMVVPAQLDRELATDALMKLAYRGEISRGLFPLTEEFACHSNNSNVALTGKPVIVDNVKDYVDGGGCYYECDNRVQSEYCHPFFDEEGESIGIIDIESFTPSVFSDEKMMAKLKPKVDDIEMMLRRFVS